jgi:thiol-disulfide isomerase/thioredoxin
MKTLSIREPGWRPFLGQVSLAGTRRPRRRLGDAATELNDDNFQQALKAQTAVVDFWSPSCMPCVRSKPIFDDIATNPPGNLFMGTVNADEATATVKKFNVESLPTQIYFVNGVEVNRNEGAFTRDQLLAAIGQLPGPQPPITAQPQPPDQVMAPAQPVQAPAAAPAPTAPAQSAPAPLPPPPPPSPAAAMPSTAPPVQVPPGVSSTTILIGAASLLAIGAGIFLLAKP